MFLKKENFYHPYVESYLALSTYDEQRNGNDTNYVLKDIDLYYQPVEDPFTGIVILVIGIISVVFGELIQFRLFSMVKRENGLVKEVTQIYSLTSMIAYPVMLAVNSGTDFMHPLNEVIGQWFCTLAWMVTFYFLNRTLSFRLQGCPFAALKDLPP